MELPDLSLSTLPVRRRRMRNRFGVAAAPLLVLLCAGPSSALQPLDAFLAAAHSHNPDALEAQGTADQQRAQADIALGRVLPGVSARGSFTRNQFDSVFSPGEGKPQIVLVPLHQLDGTATLTVPLVDLAGFERVAAAKTSAKSADAQLIAARLQVESQVALSYYQLVANEALATASQRALEVSRASLHLATTRYDAGVGPALDVDRARADLELQTQQVAGADLQIALSARALESASGLAPDTSAILTLADDLHLEPPLASFESQLDRLPAVAAAMDSAQAAGQQAEAQRFALLPSLAGTFTERGTSAPGFTGHEWSWQAVLSLGVALDLTSGANIRRRSICHAHGSRLAGHLGI